MKTYLFDTINKYKRFSENLDVKATLCNKSWWLFNNNGVKSLYIFQNNGDLFITTNGIGVKGTWQYIAANKTITINSNNAVMMFHPAFVDDNILTLTLDGTIDCAFLIDENNKSNFEPKSLSDLTRYFQRKEEAERKSQQEAESIQKEFEYQEQQRLLEEHKYKSSPEYQNKLQEDRNKMEAQQLKNKFNPYWPYYVLLGAWFVFIFNFNFKGDAPDILYGLLVLVGIPILIWVVAAVISLSIGENNWKKWKCANPNDPRSNYF